ncbi:MAG: RNA-binding S4 domain-containing protein [Prevotellaceae bacterium]|nr:RNA-binding S4 domain-containing protein [Prevotellaceae bacterium]
MENSSRIDKWLWCIRAYKTRSEAAEACKLGRVKVNGAEAKASRDVKAGDVISFRKTPVVYSYKVLAFPHSRVAAKLVPDFAENVTPQEELDKLNADHLTLFVHREKGTGRPTKKERRQIDFLMGEGSLP